MASLPHRQDRNLPLLLYPHRTLETIREHELAPCLALANESRSRVLEQLAQMLPGEFANRRVAAAVAQ
jgi:predicted ATP-dependent Lon-type protease